MTDHNADVIKQPLAVEREDDLVMVSGEGLAATLTADVARDAGHKLIEAADDGTDRLIEG